MNYILSNKLNIIFPLNLFNIEYFYLKNKYINLKYIYLNLYNISFLKSITHINNTYYTVLQLFNRIKKSNILTRNQLCISTKKPWKQKGLGKSRSGSFKSPLWRGGSTIFGPVSRILSIKLNTKKKKLSYIYILLNKRTYISSLFLIPTVYTFSNIKEHLEQQKRIKGIFSNKVIYISLSDIKYKINKNYSFIYIDLLNIIYFLKFEYIIFLI